MVGNARVVGYKNKWAGGGYPEKCINFEVPRDLRDLEEEKLYSEDLKDLALRLRNLYSKAQT